MSEITRKKHTGETGNGGEFGSQARDESAVAILDKPAITLIDDGYNSLTPAQFAEQKNIQEAEAIKWAQLRGFNVREEELIQVDEDGEVDCDNIRTILVDGNNHDVSEVYLRKHNDDTTSVIVVVNTNLLWNDEFTETELDHYRPVVEEVYKEWFNAELDTPDTWESVSVDMAREVPDNRLTESTAIDAAYDQYADFTNKTDPGTFNSPYIGAELRARINDTRIVDHAALAHTAKGHLLAGEKELGTYTDTDAAAFARRMNGILTEHGAGDSGLNGFLNNGRLTVTATEALLDAAKDNLYTLSTKGKVPAAVREEFQKLTDAFTDWMDTPREFPKTDD